MKVLLWNQRMKSFAKADGKWISNETEAENFETPLKAINFCELHKLANTAVIILLEKARFKVPVRCDE